MVRNLLVFKKEPVQYVAPPDPNPQIKRGIVFGSLWVGSRATAQRFMGQFREEPYIRTDVPVTA